MPLIQPVNPKIEVDTPTSRIQSVEPITLVAAGAGGYMGWRSGFGQGYAARFLGGGIGGSVAEQLAGDGSGATGLLKNRFARIGLGSAFGPTLAPNVANDVAVAGGAVLGANAPDAVKAASKAADSVMPGAGAAAAKVGREAVQAAALGGGAVAGTKLARGIGRMAGVGLGAAILGSAAHFIYPLSIRNRPETPEDKAAETAKAEAEARKDIDSVRGDTIFQFTDAKTNVAHVVSLGPAVSTKLHDNPITAAREAYEADPETPHVVVEVESYESDDSGYRAYSIDGDITSKTLPTEDGTLPLSVSENRTDAGDYLGMVLVQVGNATYRAATDAYGTSVLQASEKLE